jgi:tetratricopeptide (TPR) repeat protein
VRWLILVALVALAGAPSSDRHSIDYVVAGLRHLNAGEYGAAIERLSAARRQSPADNSIARQLANAYIGRRDAQQALDILRDLELRSHGLQRASIQAQMGQAWYHAGDFDDAAFYWELCLQADPQNRPARRGLAHIAEWEGRQGDAAYHYRYLTLTGPGDADAAYRLGLTLLDIDAKAAQASLREAQETGIEPWAGRAGQLAGILATGTRDANEAAQLGLALMELDELDAARRQFELAIARQPDYADAHAYRAHLLARQGRPASDAFALALALNPDLVMGHYLLGRYHQAKGLPSLARLEYERALALDPDNPALGIDIALTYAEEGRYEAAEQWLDAAILRAPLNPELALAQARFYIARAYRVEERGLPATEAALALDTNSAEGHELRGRARYLLGRPGEAIPDLQRALELEPDRASAHLHLGLAWQAIGEEDTAAWDFNRAVDLDPQGEDGARARTCLD